MSKEIEELKQLIEDYRTHLSDLDSTEAAIQSKIDLLDKWLNWFATDGTTFKKYDEIKTEIEKDDYTHVCRLFEIGFPEDSLAEDFFDEKSQSILRVGMDNIGIRFLKGMAYVLFGLFTCFIGFFAVPYVSRCRTGDRWTFLRYGTFFKTPQEKKFINNIGKKLDSLKTKSRKWDSFAEVVAPRTS